MESQGEPTRMGLSFPPPSTPAIGILRPPMHPSLFSEPPLPITDTIDQGVEFDALSALVDLEPTEFNPAMPTRTIDLPAECRSGLQQLLETRAQLWARLDRVHEHADRFQKLIAKTASRGQAVTTAALTSSGDPELEVTAAAETVEQEFARLQAQTKGAEALQLELISKRTRMGNGKRERQISGQRREIDTSRQRLRGLLDHGILMADRAAVRLEELLDANAVTLREVERNVARPEHAAWEMARWVGWTPDHQRQAGDVRLGAFTEERSGETLAVPVVTPLIGGGRALVVNSAGEGHLETAIGLLQSLVVRTAVTFPQQARYVLIDPGGNGLAFPMTRHLTNATLVGSDVRRHLDDVSAHVQRIVSTYLDAANTSFEDLPDEMRLGETYQLVVAADFPNGYDVRSAEALQQLARHGPRAGVYVIVHVNRDRLRDAPPEIARLTFDGAHVIDIGDERIAIGDAAGTVAFDPAPAAAIQEAVLQRIAALPPRDRAIKWEELHSLKETSWWQEKSDQQIRATLGRHGAGEVLDVWFGHDAHQLRSCVHGVLGAMPGAGKSTLLHNLICTLAVRYSPEELSLYLIDGKYGVEFQPYRNLPHAQVVSLHTSPAMARSVLDDLVAEMARRNGLFADYGVVDLPGYRSLGSPSGKLPRILLVVDEYQQLFEGDRNGDASNAFLRLSQQGRSAGIHFLLSSQRFDAGAMLHRNEIFGNVHLRLAMQLSQSDAAALTEFGVTGRRLVTAHCDRAGRVVANDRAGDDAANVAAKAALLSPERRDQLVSALARKAQRELFHDINPVVIDGSASPAFDENRHVRRLLGLETWPNDETLASFARSPREDGGLGQTDWLSAERPLPLFLGKDLNVRGLTTIVVRRRAAENVLLIGDRPQARLGMLAASLASAALARAPRDLVVLVANAGGDDGESVHVLDQMTRSLEILGIEARSAHTAAGAATAIERLASIVDDRRTLGPERLGAAPTVLMYLHDPERVPALLRVADEYGSVDSPLGQQLRMVLANGPTLGVHLIVSTSSLGALRSVLPDRSVQQEFRHRIVLPVPEEDSFVLVRSTAAATLHHEGELPELAFCFDGHTQTGIRFQPYTVGLAGVPEGSAKLTEQIAGLCEHLASRRP